MKRRIALGLLVVVAVFFLYREGKGVFIRWYADNYIERPTAVPSSERPDLICLTWSDNPRTTQTVQWRTATTVTDGAVEYRENETAPVASVDASATVLNDPMVKNDPANRRFTATVTGLKPGVTYAYRVGSRQKNVWSDWLQFTTAPEQPAPFSFVYLGDVQIGFDFFASLLNTAARQTPDAAFYVVAGDLVNNGRYRDQWDAFYAAGAGVFERRPLVPALGNHDYAKQDVPKFYLDTLALPENGPADVPAEHAYSFAYGNALFVVLDSNLDPEDQAAWLEQELRAQNATWKIAVYHHPAYSSSPNRDNPEIRESWGALFDKYDLDLALQGHDHAYLRTYPLRNEKRDAGGTYYVVTVSGKKYYDQEAGPVAEVAFPDVSTYQVIRIETNPNRLTYRAIDAQGQERDTFTMEK